MKFKQIGEYNGDIVETILVNRGIEDIPLFLKPNDLSNTNPFEIENLLKGVQILGAHMSVYSKIVIVVDADADGFLSASMLYQYIKQIDPFMNVDYVIHETKAHGLTPAIMDKLADGNYDLVIIPDAGSNDGQQIMQLYAMGMEVMVIDHHQIEEMPPIGLIINNQIGENTNKHLVGAGVTLKFLQAFDYTIKRNFAEKFKDLAAVGQVADVSDISDPEIRNLVFEGIKNLNNSFLKEALLKKDKIQPVPHDLSFSVIPMINAVVRVGTLEEKEMLFRAINNINPEIFEVDKKKKNKETGKFDKIKVMMNLQQYAVDIATKCKARQDALVKKAVAQVEKDVWTDGGVAIAITNFDESYAPLTGLIATKMINKLQKPMLLLRNHDKYYSGSGRGYDPTLDSLKDWCNDTNIFDFAQGHNQAFGLKIQKAKIDELKSKAKEVTARDFVYEVDYVSYGEVSADLIWELERNKHIFGGKVHDALFAYVNVNIEKKDIVAKGTVLSFFKNGVEFVMYGTTPEFQEQFTDGFAQSHKLDFVGKPGVNDWLGKEKPQIVIEAVEFSQPSDEEEIMDIIF